MPCYHPMIGRPTGELWPSGKKKYQFFSGDPSQAKLIWPDSIVVPCGHCIGCRLDYSRRWADRQMLELSSAKKGLFVTLTYNDASVPVQFDGDQFCGFTLYKKDLQDFMKRLRRRFDGSYGRSSVQIRFFASGEYGPRTHRPHYHCTLFGLSLDDFPDHSPQGVNDLGQRFYRSFEFESIWQKGFCGLSEVSYETCAYVARYVAKKVYKEWDPEDHGLEKEFSLMSRKPGLGAQYLEDHPDLFDYENIYLPVADGAKRLSIPNYFLNKLQLTDPDLFDRIKEKRKELSLDSIYQKLRKTDLSYPEYLNVCESKVLHLTSQINKLQKL